MRMLGGPSSDCGLRIADCGLPRMNPYKTRIPNPESLPRWWWRRGRGVGKRRLPLLLVSCANRRHRCYRSVHLHRVTRDIEADRSGHAVRLPLGHVALRVARGDETVLVAAVAAALAAAITRYVAEDFGVLGGELVRRADDLGRSRRRLRDERQRRQVRLCVRTLQRGIGQRRDGG